MSKVRVRIAPSPTGKLHIGTARTALFNYLFAKRMGGKFILRFEDTDTSRSTKESEKDILDGLKWLGLKWDEGPYYQMKRLKIYKNVADELLKKEFAYRLDKAIYLNARRIINQCKIPFKEVKKISEKDKKKTGVGYLIKLPQKDLILGEISGIVEDFVILRSNGIPTYHFAVVVDDEDMKITHVIRGQDHFSNTPKHYLLQVALGFKTPKYAHIPLTLAPDKTKLSKRHGAVSISEYQNQGYLKEALINFMVLLGWNPGKGSTKEIFSLKELEKIFSLEKIGKSPAIFNIDKLNNLNGYYIRQKNPKELLNIIRINKELNSGLEDINNVFLEKIIKVEQNRIQKLSDIKNFNFYFKEPKYNPKLLIFKKSDKEKTKRGLKAVLDTLIEQKSWSKKIEDFNEILEKITLSNNLNFGDVFWPVRVALSGLKSSPSPGELLWVFGKKKSLERVKKAFKILK